MTLKEESIFKRVFSTTVFSIYELVANVPELSCNLHTKLDLYLYLIF